HLSPAPSPPLQFEWAWQHPNSSHRLLAPPLRRPREQPISFALRLLPRLLRAPPWSRLPLKIRWLRPPRPALELAPPPHVVEEEGAGLPRLKRRKGRGQVGAGLVARVYLIRHQMAAEGACPDAGPAPSCHTHLLWGDLIRRCLGEAEPEEEWAGPDDVTPPRPRP
ncbi:SLX1 endonuclease, partial [Panurus biarmicus]|nr:SLX1 endonuclease [Panurus biarmicus]